ncbi:transcriptional regulator, marR family [Vibrio ishigakensis]|uniref:Transcriptional regulator, marR family n=1 Tax=Vibrio ishigakensis TaxID=1481914 RepID=A0A0B8P2X1_9VIBR|nr:MarR family transcriptional regulator [Vibrio ishigakensis]GAM57314.1 transcriptional regulator, marR family [Vibrio ishigakensis]
MSKTQSFDSLFHLVIMLKRKMHEKVEKLDLGITPMHVRVIKIIHRKSPCTANDISQFLNRDKAQVTRLLSSLISLELIEKMPNPEDKRSQLLSITSKGAEILEQIQEIDAEIFEQMCSDISEDELKQFKAISSKMHENLSQ